MVCSAALFFFGTGIAAPFTPVAQLVWAAPVPVLLVAPRTAAKTAFAVGFLAYFLSTSNSWFFFADSNDIPLEFGLPICLFLGLVFGLGTLLFHALVRRRLPLLAAAALPAVWVSSAYLVQTVNPMGLMGLLANNQGDHPVVLQIASVTGQWGVEFLTLFVPAALAALCAGGVRHAARWRTGVAAAVAVTVCLGYGAVRLSAEETGPSRHIALLAHNHSGWAPDVTRADGSGLVRAYAERIAALPDEVETVVLPEGAFGVRKSSLQEVLGPMQRTARTADVDIVVGLLREDADGKSNLAVTIPADGGTPTSYLKQHDRVTKPGSELDLPALGGASVGVTICGDVNFPDPSGEYARAGAETMLIPGADEDDNGWVHSRNSLLRGVENGFSNAWSARAGVLMLADGRGRVLAEASTAETPGPFTTVSAEVPPGPGATPYTDLGDWFAWLCGALLAAALVTVHRRKAPSAPNAAPASAVGGMAGAASAPR